MWTKHLVFTKVVAEVTLNYACVIFLFVYVQRFVSLAKTWYSCTACTSVWINVHVLITLLYLDALCGIKRYSRSRRL